MITFSNPWFLVVGIALVVLVAMAFVKRARRGLLLATFLGGSRAAHRLSGHHLLRLQFERIVLLGLASLAIAAAAAGPRWAPSVGEAEPSGDPQVRSVVLAIDVSSSMQETDVSPTRLGAAVRVAKALVESLEEWEVGLVLHAGKAYTLTPPTRDHRGLLYLLRGVTPTTATPWDRGSRLSAGIREGVAQLAGDSIRHEERIIVISDAAMSESEEEAVAAVRSAVASGIQVHTIGVGSAGAGAASSAQFQEPLLRRLAQIGGGTYTDGTAGWAPSGAPGGLVGASSGATRGAPWNAGGLIFWLTAAALVLVFADGLLDGEFGIKRRGPSRRTP